jgi:hypothetical protein
VAAHVEEGAKLVLAVPHDHDGHVADGRREKRGRLRDVTRWPTYCQSAEDPLALEL